MNRSIHKTAAQVARENSKRDMNDPDNPDVADLAKKLRYKKAGKKKRRSAK